MHRHPAGLRALLTALATVGVVPETGGAGSRPTIVLVHGAFENASVWKAVAQQLNRDGYETITVNLPGRDDDPTPKGAVTLDMLRDQVIAAIASESRPVVLVGHSFGGITISTVAEAVPDKIRTLVYVAAYLPRDGESLQSLSQTDADSRMGPAFVVDPQAMVARVQYEARTDLFLNDGTAAQRAGFADTMVDEPLQPPGTPVRLTAQRFGRVERTYVRTARDQVVSPSLQDRMIAATPVRAVQTLDTGHAPFITQPDALVHALETLVSR